MSRPEGVDADGEIVNRSAAGVAFPDRIRLSTDPMDEAEAKLVVRGIKFYGVRMCQELVRAHDGSAWIALGYGTWDDFCVNELKITRQRANQLIASARKQAGLALMFEVAVEALQIPERWLRGATVEELAPYVETAVSTLPAGASADQRAAAIHDGIATFQEERTRADAGKKITKTETVTHKRQTVIEDSPDSAPGDAAGPSSLSQGPAATSPDDRQAHGGERDTAPDEAMRGASGAEDAPSEGLPAADGEVPEPVEPTADLPSSPGPGTESTRPDAVDRPTASGENAEGDGVEPVAPSPSRVASLIAGALELAALDVDAVAALYVGEERETLRSDVERLAAWCVDMDSALSARGLRSVG